MKIRTFVALSAACAAAMWGCTPPGASTGPKGSPSKAVSLLAGQTGTQGFSNGTGAAAAFSYPAGAVILGASLYVADSGNSTIRRINPATGAVTTFAGQAGVAGVFDATGTAAVFDHPEGITTDGIDLYVADSGSNLIRKVTTGAVVTTIAGTPFVAGSANGNGVNNSTFNNPLGITFAGGNLYVADSGNSTIREVTLPGVVSTIAGSAAAPGFANGTGAAASFFAPYAVTTDGTDLYVADTGNHVIRRVVIATGVVSTIAGQPGVSGNADGTGASAAFDWPEGIAIDSPPVNLYIADTVNCTVRQLVIATGAVSTLAGQSGVPGAADGSGDTASFNDPMGIAVNVTKVYVSDMFNSTIRLVQ